ncbi:ABC transporter ATP-binding protein [Staphylothermus hellenicus]|uniref:ABC transporter related protein n=1 Tax=Staphylothermus hellenicus (strain DSM 12710 / JCM 10830 / BK20S6-10-b1 / P8) TaxID=591019 RepID=D7DC91_STAHD|nr:ABC transporter ATP-binding protein [Staphylothermus hellenicus]ADI31788.1 ABC transporter related protein [Staphylothermus hellenicus DSM 12710]
MTRVRLENVTKVYGSVVAVDHISFEVESGELFTLLGPSGCGKTTTLRIIAGFEVPEEGKVYFDDEEVTFLKPYLRNTAMVFQNYALWPHMTVYDNVAYGLRIRRRKLRLSEEDIRRKVRWALELVKLEGLENRYPLQLSGGQQQRVALARALVVEPRVLLLDEPLSNLDAKLRIEMREEIKRLQKKLGITTIYVTHDQIEAMSISDRIAVMNKGKLLQYGAPREVYFKPTNLFVADFLGRSNILYGEFLGWENEYALVRIPDLDADILGVSPHKDLPRKVAVVMRPEIMKITESRVPTDNYIIGKIDLVMFLGDRVEVRLSTGKTSLIVYLPNTMYPTIGQELKLVAPKDNVIVIPAVWE